MDDGNADLGRKSLAQKDQQRICWVWVEGCAIQIEHELPVLVREAPLLFAHPFRVHARHIVNTLEKRACGGSHLGCQRSLDPSDGSGKDRLAVDAGWWAADVFPGRVDGLGDTVVTQKACSFFRATQIASVLERRNKALYLAIIEAIDELAWKDPVDLSERMLETLGGKGNFKTAIILGARDLGAVIHCEVQYRKNPQI